MWISVRCGSDKERRQIVCSITTKSRKVGFIWINLIKPCDLFPPTHFSYTPSQTWSVAFILPQTGGLDGSSPKLIYRTDYILLLWTFHHKNVTQSEQCLLGWLWLPGHLRTTCVTPPIEEVRGLVMSEAETVAAHQSLSSQETLSTTPSCSTFKSICLKWLQAEVALCKLCGWIAEKQQRWNNKLSNWIKSLLFKVSLLQTASGGKKEANG